MARKPRTQRERQLDEALANLRMEKAALKRQQARVAAARRELALLSRCDWCGDKTLPTGAELQLCQSCSKERRERKRVQLLAQHGYGPDGKRLAAA